MGRRRLNENQRLKSRLGGSSSQSSAAADDTVLCCTVRGGGLPAKRSDAFQPRFQSLAGIRAVLIILLLLGSCHAALRADEAPATAPTAAPEAPAAVATPIPINCDVPPYTDRGVTMAPLRAFCQALDLMVDYNDGLITLQQKNAGTEGVSLTARSGGQSADVRSGKERRSLRLPAPIEERLGTVFVPLKTFAEAFNASADGLAITNGDRRSTLVPPAVTPPAGRTTATVSISNHTGRAISLHLSGPRKVLLELGRGETVLLKLLPGSYNYEAASTGLKVRTGTRRFAGDSKVTWIWGGR